MKRRPTLKRRTSFCVILFVRTMVEVFRHPNLLSGFDDVADSRLAVLHLETDGVGAFGEVGESARC